MDRIEGEGGKATNTFYFINFIVLFAEGKLREHESSDSGAESYESSDSMLQSWNSQSSLVDLQRVPSYESFEDDCSQSLCLNKPTMSFKDYIQERSDPVEQGKPVIPAAILAGFTGE